MHERIRELIQQATKVYKPDWNGAEGFEEFDREKFAELIVQECANTIQAEKDTGLYNAQQMAGMSASKAVIKNHFGVK